MTESITPINVPTDAWVDLVDRVNEIIGAFANNVASTGGTVNGNITVNGSFYATNVYSGGTLVVKQDRTITAGTGLTGGGSLANNITIALSSNTVALLDKANTALQTSDFVGTIGLQNSVSISQISATGTANSTTYLAGDGAWKEAGGGSGDVVSVNEITPDLDGNVSIDANNIPFTPSGELSSTTVQGAVTELENEKATKTSIRERLTANRTYYVRPDGNDSNNGLSNTSGGAFLTLQRAMDVITATIDAAGFSITVQVGNGTYTAGVQIRPVVGLLSPASLVFSGNIGTPEMCVLNMTGTSAFTVNGIDTGCLIRGFKITGTGSTRGILVSAGGYVNFTTMDFGDVGATGMHIYAGPGGLVEASGDYTISGGGLRHWQAERGGNILVSGRTITITNTPAFNRFAGVTNYSNISAYGNTFTGSATGSRFQSNYGGMIFTNQGGPNYLPGNSGGLLDYGGMYDNSVKFSSPIVDGAVIEDIFPIVDGGAVALDPNNGSIQTWTLGANRTPTASSNWINGQSMTLMVQDGTAYTLTWTSVGVKWVGNTAPTLHTTDWTVLELWKLNNQIYGAYVGDVPV